MKQAIEKRCMSEDTYLYGRECFITPELTIAKLLALLRDSGVQ